jgi:ferredoxin-NADP reductase
MLDLPQVTNRDGNIVTAGAESVTAPLLLACIFAALLLQLVGVVGVVLWRRRGVLTPQERDDGEVAPGSAVWRDFRVERREFEDAARTQCSFLLKPVDGVTLPPFMPGQFLTFSLPVKDASAAGATDVIPRTIVRCYSVSDRPRPDSYRVTIKRVPAPADRPALPPGVSSGHFHDRVREGDVLRVKAPAGHFHIDPDTTEPVVLVAGGIGITPLMSMLLWCLDEQPERAIHLYYGVRELAEQAFRAQLAMLAIRHPNFRLNVVVSRPSANELPDIDFQHAGRIDVDLLRRTLPAGNHHFYVCGPAPMMESLVPALIESGVPKANVHYEAFGPATVRPATDAVETSGAGLSGAVDVRFLRSGRTLSWEGTDASLLEFAERHGVAVDSGCRSGGCGTCETRLVSGTVQYASEPEHEIASGHCLLCIGTPASALVLEA